MKIVPLTANYTDVATAFSALRVDEEVAHEVASAYLDGPGRASPLLEASYAQLALESDALFAAITASSHPDPMRVRFTQCEEPYESAQELIVSVTRERLLEVTVAATDCDRFHPMLDWAPGGTFDRFRAVHDILGHGHLKVGFDRHAEYATWRFQEGLHSELARHALAVELHAKHSVRWTSGQSANHKAMLIDAELVERSRLAGTTIRPAAGKNERREQ